MWYLFAAYELYRKIVDVEEASDPVGCFPSCEGKERRSVEPVCRCGGLSEVIDLFADFTGEAEEVVVVV
jgi:hypothetical protein